MKRSTMLRNIAVGALLAGVVMPSFADDNWYIGGQYSLVRLKDSEGKNLVDPASNPLCPVAGTVSADVALALGCSTLGGAYNKMGITWDDGDGYGLFLGYNFAGRPRVELSLKQMENDTDKVEFDGAPAPDFSEKIESISLLSNLWFDFNEGGVIQPYIGFGLGASQIDFADEDDIVLMGQVGLGLNFRLGKVVMLDLGARYFDTEDSELGSYELEYQGGSVGLGIRFNFPEKNKEPEAPPAPLDTDGDGVPDSRDQCPGTPPGTPVNENGCSDLDGDGVSDNLDLCPGTPAGTAVDARGCSDVDGDGITDRVDACPNTPAGQNVMANGCAVEQSVILEGVNFEFGSAKLEINARHILDLVADSLIKSPGFVVELQGHTDNIGSDGYNLMLSQDRADSVKNYLVSKGVGYDQMVARGYGERQPVADNGTDDGREKNRRVEMKVIAEPQQ